MHKENRIMARAGYVIKSGCLDSVQRARKKYAQLMEPVCREWDLTRNELDILLFLANNPGCDRAADIVAVRGIAKSHVSLSVGNLEHRGFLMRQSDPVDRRTVRLKLTEAAMPAVSRGHALQKRFFDGVFHGITEEEMALWQDILERTSRNVSQLEIETV